MYAFETSFTRSNNHATFQKISSMKSPLDTVDYYDHPSHKLIMGGYYWLVGGNGADRERRTHSSSDFYTFFHPVGTMVEDGRRQICFKFQLLKGLEEDIILF